MNINDYSGAKLAVLARDHVLVLLRDDLQHIPYPNLWDLPGGGREGREAPLDCALRETFEEAGLRISPLDVSWKRLYPNPQKGALAHWFFVAKPGWLTLPPVQLGNEGQELRWMPVETFLAHDRAIPHLQNRLQDYLQRFASNRISSSAPKRRHFKTLSGRTSQRLTPARQNPL